MSIASEMEGTIKELETLLQEVDKIPPKKKNKQASTCSKTEVRNGGEEVVEAAEERDDRYLDTKPPKGSTDYDPQDMVIREKMMRDIQEELRRCGCVSLETPVFELKETLCGNYGEDEKLIYELKDQGGELLALRYDHTVPLARYVAKKRTAFTKTLRAARIGKVYRRDQPNRKKGRLREFYQCDLDIVRFGKPDNVDELTIDDAEVVNMVCSCLTRLIGRDAFRIRVNNRKLFDCVLSLFGVSQEKFREVGSSVDKLDKMPWEDVKKEMTEVKGLTDKQAEGIYKYIKINGTIKEVSSLFRNDKTIMEVEGFAAALKELELLFTFLESYGWSDKVSFDMSMVRGLDYYTGMILEGNLVNDNGIGSISGGGRYNNLVNRFCPGDFPCTGASVGFERIFSYLVQKQELEGIALKRSCTQVMVLEVAGRNSAIDLLPERMKLLTKLRANGIAAEIFPRMNPSFPEQMDYMDSWLIPFAVIIGEDEVKNGTCNVKRKYYQGDKVKFQQKKGPVREGTYVGLQGKNANIDTGKKKPEPVKKGQLKSVVTETGKDCPIDSNGVKQDDLISFFSQYISGLRVD